MLKIRTICVTRRHIKLGVPKHIGFCPIAIALREAFPNAQVQVTKLGVFIACHKTAKAKATYLSALDSSADYFIDRFDNRGFAEPTALTFKFVQII